MIDRNLKKPISYPCLWLSSFSVADDKLSVAGAQLPAVNRPWFEVQKYQNGIPAKDLGGENRPPPKKEL